MSEQVDKSLATLIATANAILAEAAKNKELRDERENLMRERIKLNGEIAALKLEKTDATKDAHKAEVHLKHLEEQISEAEGAIDMVRKDAARMRRQIDLASA